MENLYIELIKQVEENGDLSPYGRERLWKAFEEETDFATAKTKRLALELSSLQKVIDGWKKEAPISKRLQNLYKKVVNAIQEDSQELDQLLPQFTYYCDNPKCQTEWFFGRDKVLYVERHTHFAKIKKMSGMPKKICALFGIE